jgi:uncharacterized protein YprB with RNaseH-like and TPR domain
MLSKLNLSNVLFLDIETVPQQRDFSDLETQTQNLYAEKTRYQRKDEISPADFYDRAGIWAEFGKIVCISVGYLVDKETREFRVRSFSGEEKELLVDFKELVEEHFSKRNHCFCAHNGKEFDYPFIARRMIIHGIELPEKLVFFNKKPWEINHLDTMEMWKFGDYKHFTSLKLLTHILGIPSPKGDIDGSMVRDVYYEDGDLDRIVKYCETDVIALAQVLMKLSYKPLLTDEEIVLVSSS